MQSGHKNQHKLVSFIRTIPSALEFHQISACKAVVGYTTGEELHLALKQTFCKYNIILYTIVNTFIPLEKVKYSFQC